MYAIKVRPTFVDYSQFSMFSILIYLNSLIPVFLVKVTSVNSPNTRFVSVLSYLIQEFVLC